MSSQHGIVMPVRITMLEPGRLSVQRWLMRTQSVCMYMELFYWLLGQSRGASLGHKDAVRLIDSTTIDLCKQAV